MRWFWIDKFVDFVPKTSATAIKSVSQAEEQVHDLYPAFPIHPNSLIIEGMAQTAGILVGEARGFKEKVILAKIGRAKFHRLTRPGEMLAFHATIEQLSDHGASVTGIVKAGLETGAPLTAEIDLMFSHIDNNLAGTAFPEHNFVFTEQFTDLIKTYRMNAGIKI